MTDALDPAALEKALNQAECPCRCECESGCFVKVAIEDGIRAYKEAEAAALPGLAARHSFWVVERFENGKSAGYWDGGHSRAFIKDINEAVQFCRRQDAMWVIVGWHWDDVHITEHLYLTDAREAAAKLAMVGKPGWRDDMENAPKDGTRVYLSDGNSVWIGMFDSVDLRWRGDWGVSASDYERSADDPIRWQPLPAAPSITESEVMP